MRLAKWTTGLETFFRRRDRRGLHRDRAAPEPPRAHGLCACGPPRSLRTRSRCSRKARRPLGTRASTPRLTVAELVCRHVVGDHRAEHASAGPPRHRDPNRARPQPRHNGGVTSAPTPRFKRPEYGPSGASPPAGCVRRGRPASLRCRDRRPGRRRGTRRPAGSDGVPPCWTTRGRRARGPAPDGCARSRRRRPAQSVYSVISVGSDPALKTRSNSASASAPAPSPWYRSTTVRARSRLASTGASSPLANAPPTSSTRSGCQPVVDREVLGHQLVGDAHQLAELLPRRLGDADVVAERLRHLLAAVETLEQRRGHDDLRAPGPPDPAGHGRPGC